MIRLYGILAIGIVLSLCCSAIDDVAFAARHREEWAVSLDSQSDDWSFFYLAVGRSSRRLLVSGVHDGERFGPIECNLAFDHLSQTKEGHAALEKMIAHGFDELECAGAISDLAPMLRTPIVTEKPTPPSPKKSAPNGKREPANPAAMQQESAA